MWRSREPSLAPRDWGRPRPTATMRRRRGLSPNARDFWAGAQSTDSWMLIVARAFLTLGRAVTLDRLYAAIERHPKAAGKRSFWRHHVHEVLERVTACDPLVAIVIAGVFLDPDIWRLISEHPTKGGGSIASPTRSTK